MIKKLSKQEAKDKLLLAKLQEKYFDDLTLEKFAKSRITAVDLEDVGRVYSDLPYISIVRKYSIRVTNPAKGETAIGACDYENKVIKLYRGRYERSKTIIILHEMVHAYDSELSKYPTWRDFVLIYLYRKLSNLFGRKKINRIVFLESHPDFFVNTGHNILFVLKCLELDLRLKKKLGTVFAYGRSKHFNE